VLKFVFVIFLILSSAICMGLTDAASFAAQLFRYKVETNIVYHAKNDQNKLDVYRPAEAPGPTPVVVFIHGGGWVEGTKEERVLEMMPYLQMGFAAVNLEYRFGRISMAPAAVQDCRCALHWVFANAKKYNFDPFRVVLQGGSAGGHLALMSGMLTPAAGFDRECRASADDYYSENPGTGKDPRVAAIVNWFGITDVLDELHGTNAKGYTVAWVGDQPNADEIAKRVSPINHVTKDLPPTLTIHGDKDALVPYEQAVRLHKAPAAAKVRNELYTVAGANHGGYTLEPNQEAGEAVRRFLAENVKGLDNTTKGK